MSKACVERAHNSNHFFPELCTIVSMGILVGIHINCCVLSAIEGGCCQRFHVVGKLVANFNFFGSWTIMKSTKVQNPRCIPRIKPIMRAYWPPIAVQLLPGQYSLLRRLAASCIVWDKAEPAIRTIPHDALNGRWCTSISSVTLPGCWVTKLYACALLIIDGLGPGGEDKITCDHFLLTQHLEMYVNLPLYFSRNFSGSAPARHDLF